MGDIFKKNDDDYKPLSRAERYKHRVFHQYLVAGGDLFLPEQLPSQEAVWRSFRSSGLSLEEWINKEAEHKQKIESCKGFDMVAQFIESNPEASRRDIRKFSKELRKAADETVDEFRDTLKAIVFNVERAQTVDKSDPVSPKSLPKVQQGRSDTGVEK